MHGCPLASISLISGIFPRFQHVTSKQDLHLSSPPSSFWDDCFFLGTFLSYLHFFLDPQAHGVSNPNSPCAEAQRVISLVVCGSVSSLSNTGGLRACHFCLIWVLQKFATSLYQLQLASSRLLLESSKFSSENFSPPASLPPTTNYLPTVSVHNLSYFVRKTLG